MPCNGKLNVLMDTETLVTGGQQMNIFHGRCSSCTTFPERVDLVQLFMKLTVSMNAGAFALVVEV